MKICRLIWVFAGLTCHLLLFHAVTLIKPIRLHQQIVLSLFLVRFSITMLFIIFLEIVSMKNFYISTCMVSKRFATGQFVFVLDISDIFFLNFIYALITTPVTASQLHCDLGSWWLGVMYPSPPIR